MSNKLSIVYPFIDFDGHVDTHTYWPKEPSSAEAAAQKLEPSTTVLLVEAEPSPAMFWFDPAKERIVSIETDLHRMPTLARMYVASESRWRDYPASVLDPLVDDPEDYVRLKVSQVDARLSEFFNRFKFYRTSHLTAEMLDRLAKQRDVKATNRGEHNVHENVAAHNSTSSATLRLLAPSTLGHVRAYVAEHPNTEVDVLREIAKTDGRVQFDGSSLHAVQNGLARNINTPPEILEQLAESDGYIPHTVAMNPKAPERVLRRLAKSENNWSRRGVAVNINTPRDVLDMLAEDVSASVLMALAGNINASTETLDKVYGRKDFVLKENNGNEDFLLILAKNPRSSQAILGELAQKNAKIRLLVAENHGASAETLFKLSKDRLKYIVDAALANPSYRPLAKAPARRKKP